MYLECGYEVNKNVIPYLPKVEQWFKKKMYLTSLSTLLKKRTELILIRKDCVWRLFFPCNVLRCKCIFIHRDLKSPISLLMCLPVDCLRVLSLDNWCETSQGIWFIRSRRQYSTAGLNGGIWILQECEQNRFHSSSNI